MGMWDRQDIIGPLQSPEKGRWPETSPRTAPCQGDLQIFPKVVPPQLLQAPTGPLLSRREVCGVWG